MKIAETFMAELHRVHQELTNLIGRLDERVMALIGKHKEAQIKCE